ncbi:MAG: radical SAM family heme chaperone HemW [Rhodobacter sp.]|nr:radical SAM family heme chaperone HemW [Rhodobacter sp.]
MPEIWQTAGFGLYIHWPFCQAKCPYCDFNSHVAASIDQTRWGDAYLSEIRRVGADTSGRVLGSVYFGGGTPSLMEAALVSRILETISATWTLANDIEITLEANPTSSEATRFEGYRAAGINRVSVGVQALNDSDLRALGRLHSAAEAQAAVEIAKDTFDHVSFDLIYARQDQTLQEWTVELKKALGIAGDHISLYQLTVEDGTAFGDRLARGRLPGLPDDDLAADLYLVTQEICDAAGFPAYEISNHARPGAESRHNLTYWRGGDYAAIGPGAHGRLTRGGQRIATETHLAPAKWLRAVETAKTGESSRVPVSQSDQFSELLMMGLRIREGVSMTRLERLGGSNGWLKKVSQLQELGLVDATDRSLAVTDRGRPVLNAVLRDLLAG